MNNNYRVNNNEDGSYSYISLYDELSFVNKIYSIRGMDIKINPYLLNIVSGVKNDNSDYKDEDVCPSR